MNNSCIECVHYTDGRCKPYDDFIGWIKINNAYADSVCRWRSEAPRTDEENK